MNLTAMLVYFLVLLSVLWAFARLARAVLGIDRYSWPGEKIIRALIREGMKCLKHDA